MLLFDLSTPLRDALVLSLIDSLWIGALFIAGSWFLRNIIGPDPQKRYLLSILGLAGFLLATVLNFIHLYQHQGTNGLQPSLIPGIYLPEQSILWIYRLWLAGSLVFLLRFIASHIFIKNLISKAQCIEDLRWVQRFEVIRSHFNEGKQIMLVQSNRICSAFVTGVIKPVIIIPTSWINQLDAKEIECILAHELSHIRSKDHWINLFIQLMEMVFYFNPAVHIFISHIKLDRELQADLHANDYVRSPILYAKLILKVEEQSGMVPLFSIPFFRQRNQLRRRIESVLNLYNPKNNRENSFSLIAAFCCLVFLTATPEMSETLSTKLDGLCWDMCETNDDALPELEKKSNVQAKKWNSIAHVQRKASSPVVEQPQSKVAELKSQTNELSLVKIYLQETIPVVQVHPESQDIHQEVIHLLTQDEITIDSIQVVDGDGAWIISNQGKSFHKQPSYKILLIKSDQKKSKDTEASNPEPVSNPTNDLFIN